MVAVRLSIPACPDRCLPILPAVSSPPLFLGSVPSVTFSFLSPPRKNNYKVKAVAEYRFVQKKTKLFYLAERESSRKNCLFVTSANAKGKLIDCARARAAFDE